MADKEEEWRREKRNQDDVGGEGPAKQMRKGKDVTTKESKGKNGNYTVQMNSNG